MMWLVPSLCAFALQLAIPGGRYTPAGAPFGSLAPCRPQLLLALMVLSAPSGRRKVGNFAGAHACSNIIFLWHAEHSASGETCFENEELNQRRLPMRAAPVLPKKKEKKKKTRPAIFWDPLTATSIGPVIEPVLQT